MQTTEYYDVFISFKNSDEKGNNTLDKEIAYELYKYLSKHNLKVFFSSETLAEHGTDQWRLKIEHAIGVSKVFIAMGSQKKYMESKWLQWERIFFLGLRSQDKSKVIYNYILSPMEIGDLPHDIKEISTFTPNNREELYKYISNHLSKIEKEPSYNQSNKLEIFPLERVNLKKFYTAFTLFSITFFTLFLIWTSVFSSVESKDFVSIFLIISFIFTKLLLNKFTYGN